MLSAPALLSINTPPKLGGWFEMFPQLSSYWGVTLSHQGTAREGWGEVRCVCVCVRWRSKAAAIAFAKECHAELSLIKREWFMRNSYWYATWIRNKKLWPVGSLSCLQRSMAVITLRLYWGLSWNPFVVRFGGLFDYRYFGFIIWYSCWHFVVVAIVRPMTHSADHRLGVNPNSCQSLHNCFKLFS